MLPASSLGWKHARLHTWIRGVTGAPGRETGMGNGLELLHGWDCVVWGFWLLPGFWHCMMDSLKLWTQLHPRREIRASSLASKASVRITSLPFPPPPASLLLSWKDVQWTSWSCHPGSLEPQFLALLLFKQLFITTWALHLSCLLQGDKGGGATLLILNGWANGVIKRLSILFEVTKSQTWDFTWLCCFSK